MERTFTARTGVLRDTGNLDTELCTPGEPSEDEGRD